MSGLLMCIILLQLASKGRSMTDADTHINVVKISDNFSPLKENLWLNSFKVSKEQNENHLH